VYDDSLKIKPKGADSQEVDEEGATTFVTKPKLKVCYVLLLVLSVLTPCIAG
jgi:hypothetical protein